MSTLSIADAPSNSCSGSALTYRQRIAVLWAWCLCREALLILPQTIPVAPLLLIVISVAGLVMVVGLSYLV